MVQPFVNPVHLCPNVKCVTSFRQLSTYNVHSLFNKKMPFLFKSSKELTYRSGKDQNRDVLDFILSNDDEIVRDVVNVSP